MPRSSNPSQLPSDRSFGLLFTVVSAIVAAFPLFRGGEVRFWAVVAAVLFLAASFLYPKLLNPLNRIWMWFGELLHKIMTPLIMSVLFFVTVTPIGLMMRLFGKNPLRLGFDDRAESYWIEREQDSPTPKSMERQF